jgi:hypothetical protein
MPTVLYIKGWRLFFYSNEGNEPIHIHGQKGDKECKYWLDVDRLSEKSKMIHSRPLNPPNLGDFELFSPQNWGVGGAKISN